MSYIKGSECAICKKELFVAEPGNLMMGDFDAVVNTVVNTAEDTAYKCNECGIVSCAACIKNTDISCCNCTGNEFNRIKDKRYLPLKAKEEMNDQTEILKYWEASDKKACGNCMHFSFPVVGEPVCTIPDFLIPEGCPKEEIKSGNKVKPEDRCLFWAKRQGGL